MSAEVINRPRNARVALIAAGAAAGMLALAYASVPLYRLFCQVTGFGGTTQVAAAAPGAPAGADLPTMTVRFDASVTRGMTWRFAPLQRSVEIKLGEEMLISYRASNPTDEPVGGQASFNVTPTLAGKYFHKIECFCFTDQTLEPGESVEMPVSFFVDPDILKDRDLKGLREITLSYTFHRTDGRAGGPRS